MVSWSCTGLGAGEETGYVQHLARQRVHLCIVDEVVGLVAVAPKMVRWTVCLSRPAAN